MTDSRIRRLLIANRGEIAVRIIRTCRELGIETVAVYSDVDQGTLHTRLADEAHLIGPASASASYLVQERLLEVADRSGVDAVHPGYGFLSENAEFAEACRSAGLIFVGPPAEAIRLMGDKTAARREMAAAGVPMAPGSTGAVDLDGARALAKEIGYPVLVKAAAGGGGKGMRIVESASELERAMQSASSEAASAFGDSRVYVERFLRRPRHIEFQILADGFGSVVHLFERECSIQRRHQKVIEEAPSSLLTPDQRSEMGAAAIRAAQSCGYVNAGTVEFLVDESGAFYFMEMNTRLQVEHPVTEAITGLDLVAEQLRIAEGEALGYDQSALTMRGHAIECRIYAEDPVADFMPAPGPIHRHRIPSGIGVRVDAGVEEGMEVPLHYDPMIAKVTTWGLTRAEAINRMHRALGEYEIAGVPTTLAFCRHVMTHPAFVEGRFDIGFVGEHFDAAVLSASPQEHELAAMVAAFHAARVGSGHKGASGPEVVQRRETAWRRRRFE